MEEEEEVRAPLGVEWEAAQRSKRMAAVDANDGESTKKKTWAGPGPRACWIWSRMVEIEK